MNVSALRSVPGLNLRLRLSIRRPPSLRRASQWTHNTFPPFFTRSPAIRFSVGRRALWLLPIAGGLGLFLLPPQRSVSASILSSAAIPSHSAPPTAITILSPLEESDRTITQRVLTILRNRIWEPLLTAKRFVHLFVLFVPVIICSPMMLVGKPEKHLQGDRWGALWWYDFLVSRMEAAGPTFIKLAQWAATRADLFPAPLCERLSLLHSSGKPHSIEHTRAVIERAFQKPFEDVFEEFDATPIGTGAIAQVYRATLKRDLIPPSYLDPRRSLKATAIALKEHVPSVPSAAVAIKVLHPRVEKTISRDVTIMSCFATLLTLFPGMKWLSLSQEVEVFGAMMSQQLDLRNEAENLCTFEKNFAPRKVPVTFPRPLKVWSTRNLLVEEFENAIPLESFLLQGSGPFDEQLATIGLDAFLNMLLLDNFVHSDLHPGNIMVKFCKPPTTWTLLTDLYKSTFYPEKVEDQPQLTVDQESERVTSRLRSLSHSPASWLSELDSLYAAGYMPEVVFLDAGLVTTLDSTNRRNFLDLFRAVAEFDGYRAGHLMVDRCRSPELAIDRETFALKMQHIILGVKRKTFSLGQIKISDVLIQALRAVREHHVRMEGDFINTVISILLLEGIGRQLDPGLDLFSSSLPILRQLGGQMAMRESKKNLPHSNLGALLKVWVWLEARSLISSAFINIDDLVKYDWLTQSF
ncbi:ABC1-domain-containing protein [Pluteus cervinus]|uniref:ABC1-domain-containing protein n=1 Tax=Pluteus cervinus TaxID=181527 RepID=A0ACD3BIA1_9AGAR|nr:ABC1-domain-containing protein [Pluteus cervinus]